jgi:hypothetical protein
LQNCDCGSASFRLRNCDCRLLKSCACPFLQVSKDLHKKIRKMGSSPVSKSVMLV